MPVIAIVVGVIGSAVGTAIAGTVFGAVAGGIGMAIGAAIGAGVAGGLLSVAMGGKFGTGFAMGAIGSIVGGFLNGGLGSGVEGAGSFASGDAGLLAQGGADFMPDALSGMGDLAGGAVAAGIGDLPPSNYGAVGEVNPNGVTTYGLGETMSPTGTALAGASAPSWELGLQEGVNAGQMADLGGGPSLATSAGLGGDYSVSAPTEATYFPGSETSYAPAAPAATGPQTLEGIASQQPGGVTDPGYTLGDNPAGSFGPPPPAAPQSSPSTGLKGMFKTSDAWLKDNLGAPQGSTGKLLMGGADALMKNYQASKLERQAQGLAPMSFEEYQAKFANANDYKVAANSMGKAGRTGTLPVLLARMQERARAGYAGYLPGAQKDQFDRQVGFAKARTGALQNLFTPAYAGAQ